MMELSRSPADLVTEPHVQLSDAIAHHYTLERQIGRGGMATVYLRRNPRFERLLAGH